MLAVEYEPDAEILQQHCSRDRGDPDAIGLISKVSPGVLLFQPLYARRRQKSLRLGLSVKDLARCD